MVFCFAILDIEGGVAVDCEIFVDEYVHTFLVY